jgi:hypothetical protein
MSTEINQAISDGMDQAVEQGFEIAKLRVQHYLIERADWLRREWQNGGDWNYLHIKEDDCRYIATVVAEMKMAPTDLHQPSCSICRRDHGPEIVHECE